MSRQLHPGLFDETMAHLSLQGPLEPLSSQNFPQLDRLEDNYRKLGFEIDEIKKTSNLKVDKLKERLDSMDQRFNQLAHEVREKLSFLAIRVKEKSGTEGKTEALLDRHNQIIQNFELRLGQAQRLIENQSMQLSKQQFAIEEARKQIERLKKL